MPLEVYEWFGHPLSDQSAEAESLRKREHCPFLNSRCTKSFNDRSISGACSMLSNQDGVVCTCPKRLYAEDFLTLSDVARLAFGQNSELVHPLALSKDGPSPNQIVPLGQGSGREVRLPGRKGKGQFSVDWVLCRLNAQRRLLDFVAVEVQTIDTTGTYRPEVEQYRRGVRQPLRSVAGLNWENVNKRILPQLIFKGHVLRREALCTKGLFFVCPSTVYHHIQSRLGDSLMPYPNLQPGCITFLWYDIDVANGGRLRQAGHFTTTIDQVAIAFTSPRDLPDAGVYQKQIESVIASLK